MKVFTPRDVVALASLATAGIFAYFHMQEVVALIITGVVGYYFGHRTSGVDTGE